jgi:hypothetical protein
MQWRVAPSTATSLTLASAGVEASTTGATENSASPLSQARREMSDINELLASSAMTQSALPASERRLSVGPKAGYASRRGFERLKMFVLAALSIAKDPTTMKDNAAGSLDRRDFVIASLATVGAPAAFAATAGATDAEDKTATPQPTGTAYTGDLIGGKKVISALDVKGATS